MSTACHSPRRHRAALLAAAVVQAVCLVCLAGPARAADPLPPEALWRQALQQSPAADAALADWRASQAQAVQTRLGPHDWVLRAGIARRSEAGGPAFAEREIGLERTLRWGAKAAQDAGLADQGLRLAALRRQAAWQDAADALLARWFDARRDAQAAAHQRQQQQLAQAQVTALQRRVAAGDAAALLLRQAEGEAARTGAARAAAEQRADASRQALLGQHPVLAAAWPADADAGAPADRSASAGVASPVTAPATAAPPADAGPTTPAGLVAQILDRHPALAAARADLDLLRLQLRRLEADRSADPTLGLRLAQERGGAERVVGLSVSVPFGPALRDSRVQAGSAALAAGEARLRALQQQAETEAHRLAAAPGQAALVLQRLQDAARAATTSAALTARAQAAGEATLAELLQQQRAAGDAALAATLAATDLQQAEARLQLALQQWLAPPPL